MCARISVPRVGGIVAFARNGAIDVFKERVMKSFKGLLTKLAKDERGGEVLEYALIAGLIVVAAIAVIGAVGTKVVARWNSLDSGL